MLCGSGREGWTWPGAEQGDRQGVRGRGWPGWSWVRKGGAVGSGAEVREPAGCTGPSRPQEGLNWESDELSYEICLRS